MWEMRGNLYYLMNAKGFRYKKDDILIMCELWKFGVSQSEIGRIYGLDHSTINQHISKYVNMKIKKTPKIEKPKPIKAAKLRTPYVKSFIAKPEPEYRQILKQSLSRPIILRDEKGNKIGEEERKPQRVDEAIRNSKYAF